MRKLLHLLIAAVCLAAGAARAAGFLELLTADAQAPSYLADPNDGTGRLFISELGGHVRIWNGTSLQSSADAFLDLSGEVDFGGAGEGGLHSIAFDPGFATNRKIYVAYTRTGSGNSPLETVIASYTAKLTDPNHADLASRVEILLRQSPEGGNFSNHKGGQLQIGPDGMLYFAFGDGGGADDPDCRAQRRTVLFGKLIRLDPSGDDFPGDATKNYKIPAGNPFANDPNYLPEIWSMGLRNPYRFSFDRDNGDLWIGDVGQTSREEVDTAASPNRGRGDNFGWRVREGSLCHLNVPQTPQDVGCDSYVAGCTSPGYTDPVNDYGRGVGSTIIGGFVYRGSVSAFRGKYVFADHGSSVIFALTRNGGAWDRTVLSSGEISAPISFGEDHMGELYVLTQGNAVYRLHFEKLGLTKEQDACVRKLNDRFRLAANTESSQVRSCFDKAARGKLAPDTVDACAAADPKERLSKARAKAQATDTDLCVPQPPDVGYAGADAGMDAAIGSELDLAQDVLGETLDAAVIPKTADKAAAACQKAVLQAVGTCQRARRSEFMRCKKLRLKEDTLSDETLAECLSLDPKARVAKQCDATTGRIATRAIANSCLKKGVDLSTAFPGCGTDDPAGLAQCLEIVGACRTCELFDAADALDFDCNPMCVQ